MDAGRAHKECLCTRSRLLCYGADTNYHNLVLPLKHFCSTCWTHLICVHKARNNYITAFCNSCVLLIFTVSVLILCWMKFQHAFLSCTHKSPLQQTLSIFLLGILIQRTLHWDWWKETHAWCHTAFNGENFDLIKQIYAIHCRTKQINWIQQIPRVDNVH